MDFLAVFLGVLLTFISMVGAVAYYIERRQAVPETIVEPTNFDDGKDRTALWMKDEPEPEQPLGFMRYTGWDAANQFSRDSSGQVLIHMPSGHPMRESMSDLKEDARRNAERLANEVYP